MRSGAAMLSGGRVIGSMLMVWPSLATHPCVALLPVLLADHLVVRALLAPVRIATVRVARQKHLGDEALLDRAESRGRARFVGGGARGCEQSYEREADHLGFLPHGACQFTNRARQLCDGLDEIRSLRLRRHVRPRDRRHEKRITCRAKCTCVVLPAFHATHGLITPASLSFATTASSVVKMFLMS